MFQTLLHISSSQAEVMLVSWEHSSMSKDVFSYYKWGGGY